MMLGLNVAVSGALSSEMEAQAKDLVNRTRYDDDNYNNYGNDDDDDDNDDDDDVVDEDDDDIGIFPTEG